MNKTHTNRWMLLACVCVCASLTPYSLAQSVDEPKRTIRSVTIDNRSIFDLNDSRENGLFYRIANKLHKGTSKGVIETQLLFKEGDVYAADRVIESERLLRTNNYLAEATIHANVDGNFVDIVVVTQDTWSTKPKLGYSQAGGNEKSELGIKEQNLFGTGISADVSYKSNVDRSSYIVAVQDDHIFGSWYSLGLRNESSSDGQRKEIELQKPFYSLDTKSSHGISYVEDDREEAYSHLGEKYYEYALQKRELMIKQGWSAGLQNGSVLRHSVGVRYSENIYSETDQSYTLDIPAVTQFIANNTLIPKDHKDVYPYYALDYLEDRFQEAINIDRLGKTEDRYMGLRGGVEVGYASTQFGAFDDAILLKAYLGKTFNLGDNASISIDSNFNLRKQSSERRRFITSFLAKYYQEQSTHFKFYSDLYWAKGHNLELHSPLFLGGDSGLRGFPANYLSGDQIQKFTIEERYYSKAQPFRIFRLGAALFYDIARIKGGNALEWENNGTYSDVGIGLRIANNRSSLGDIIHIDLAVPVEGQSPEKGFQLNIQLKSTF